MRVAGMLLVAGAAACGGHAAGPSNAESGDAGAVDAGVVDAVAPVPDLTLPDNCNDGGANAGSRWQDLYACYFGTSGVASCAGTDDNCHGSTNGQGYLVTMSLGPGYQCPPNDPTTCWMALTSTLIKDAGSDPPSTTLLQALRQSPGVICAVGPCMPLVPSSLVFGPDDVARITAWISAGAQNN